MTTNQYNLSKAKKRKKNKALRGSPHRLKIVHMPEDFWVIDTDKPLMTNKEIAEYFENKMKGEE